MAGVNDIFTRLIPQTKITSITLSGGMGARPLKSKIKLVLRDVIEDDLVSEWFAGVNEEDPDSSPFEEFIRVVIFQCTDKDLCDAISGRRKWDTALAQKTGQHLEIRNINLKDIIPIDLTKSTSDIGIGEYKTVDAEGNEILEIPVEQTYSISPIDVRGIQHLSYFAFTSLDTGKMSKKLNIDPEYFDSVSLPKVVVSDVVIDNFNIVTSTSVYLTQNNIPWEGPIHYHGPENKGPNGYIGYMTGIKHTSDSVVLVKVIIPNPKIKDFRAVNRVDDRYISVTQQRVGAGLSEESVIVGEAIDEDVLFTSARTATKNLSVPSIEPSKKSTFFSDLFVSKDEQFNGSFCFCFDYFSCLRENSAYPHLWNVSQNTTARLLQLGRILTLEIRRTMVDTSTRTFNELGTSFLPKQLNDKFTVLATSGQRNNQFSCREIDDSKSYLKELSLETLNEMSGELRYFSFTDRTFPSLRGGVYQYSVFIRTVDPTSILMTEVEGRLRRAQQSLKQYLKLAEGFTNGRPNFDIYLDKFIPSFIEKYSSSRGRLIWKKPLDIYLESLETVSKTLKQPAYPGASINLDSVLPAALASYVDPAKGTPEGIRASLQLVDLLLAELETKTSGILIGSATSSTKSGTRKSKLNHKSSVRMIEVFKTFDQEFSLDGTRGKGYDYITNQTIDYLNESVRGRGLRTISARYFRKRCDIETKRFFEISNMNFNYINLLKAAAPDIDTGGNYADADDTLEANKFSYLTPSFLFSSPGFGMGGGYGGGGMGGGYGGGGGGATAPPAGSSAGASALGSGSPQDIIGGGFSGAAAVPTFDLSATSQQFTLDNLTMANLGATVPIAPPPVSAPIEAPPAPPPPQTLDDVAATVLENQANPDFSLFPVEIKGASSGKGSKLSSEQQSLQAKYMGVLSRHSCTVVAESEEFEEVNEYDIKIDYYGNEPLQPKLDKLSERLEYDGISEISPYYKTGIPFIPSIIKNINATPILTTLAQSKVGNGPKKSYKLQKLNFASSAGGNILDNTNPSNKASILKKLPNQLKSLVLSGEPGISIGHPFKQQSPSYMQRWENLFAVFQMFKNLVEIEYLVGFELSKHIVNESGILKRKTGRVLLKAPIWSRLTERQLRLLETDEYKGAVLCRITRYNNELLGIGPAVKMNLPIIDQHFLLTKDPAAVPVLAPETTPKAEGEKVPEIPDNLQTGNSGGDINMSSHSNDSSGANPELLEAIADAGPNGLVKPKIFKVFSVFDDSEKEIDVQPFGGKVPASQSTLGSTSGGGY